MQRKHTLEEEGGDAVGRERRRCCCSRTTAAAAVRARCIEGTRSAAEMGGMVAVVEQVGAAGAVTFCVSSYCLIMLLENQQCVEASSAR